MFFQDAQLPNSSTDLMICLKKKRLVSTEKMKFIRPVLQSSRVSDRYYIYSNIFRCVKKLKYRVFFEGFTWMTNDQLDFIKER